jgi:nitrogen fixation/metabolism regulation signal transduction histidine kinase
VRDLKELIAEFGRFSRLPEVRLEPWDPNELVRSALAGYAHGAPGQPEVVLDLGEGVGDVEADHDQMKRVLLNVANNAFEAMDGRTGEIRVATRRDGGEVVIDVCDQGPGVEDVDRIFEPYHTTKVRPRSAIARQIVEEHHGGSRWRAARLRHDRPHPPRGAS